MSTVTPHQVHGYKAESSSSSSRVKALLQRKCACGSPTASLTGECSDCMSGKHLQTKLSIGAANDPLEREADVIADHILAGTTRAAVGGASTRLQRYAERASGHSDAVATVVDNVLASPGSPLNPALRQDADRGAAQVLRIRCTRDETKRSAVQEQL